MSGTTSDTFRFMDGLSSLEPRHTKSGSTMLQPFKKSYKHHSLEWILISLLISSWLFCFVDNQLSSLSQNQPSIPHNPVSKSIGDAQRSANLLKYQLQIHNSIDTVETV